MSDEDFRPSILKGVTPELEIMFLAMLLRLGTPMIPTRSSAGPRDVSGYCQRRNDMFDEAGIGQHVALYELWAYWQVEQS